MERPVRIAIAAGGTGGHVYPALSIAEALREKHGDTDILFFGTAGKLEATVVPAWGYSRKNIWISGIHRSLRPANLLFPVKLCVALVQSWSALRAFRPDVVVGTGGYVCGPVLFAAAIMRVPTVLHESNSYPGITTRLLAKRVDALLTGFPETAQWLPAGAAVEIVGTPVRSFAGIPGRSEARKRQGLRDDDFVVFITGGSQGAESINRAIDEGMQKLLDADVRVIWQTGKANDSLYRSRYRSESRVQIEPFIEDVAVAYAAADLVVSRAGASTLAELAALGKPAILVPYPYAAEDHQMKNARTVEGRRGAVVVADAEAGHRLPAEIVRLRHDVAQCSRMAMAMQSLAQPSAASDIAERVYAMVSRT